MYKRYTKGLHGLVVFQSQLLTQPCLFFFTNNIVSSRGTESSKQENDALFHLCFMPELKLLL